MNNEKALSKLSPKEQTLARLLIQIMNCPEMSEDEISDEGQRIFMESADYLKELGIHT